MNKALDNDCFFSALSLALTLPDICGKAKYPTDGNKKRYIAWYDEYVGAYEQCPGEEGEMPYKGSLSIRLVLYILTRKRTQNCSMTVITTPLNLLIRTVVRA